MTPNEALDVAIDALDEWRRQVDAGTCKDKDCQHRWCYEKRKTVANIREAHVALDARDYAIIPADEYERLKRALWCLMNQATIHGSASSDIRMAPVDVTMCGWLQREGFLERSPSLSGLYAWTPAAHEFAREMEEK
jgi:hypothetical protein